MSMRTYDEMIAGLGNMGETLMHFNEKHDSNGRFAKKSGGSSSTASQNMVGPQRKDKYLGVSLDYVAETQMWGNDEFTGLYSASPAYIDHYVANPPDGWSRQDAIDDAADCMYWTIRSVVDHYMQSPAYTHLMDGNYHTAQEFLTGSAKLADRVYADMCTIFNDSEIMSEYLKSQEGKEVVVEIVGSQLADYYAYQTAPTPQQSLNAKKRKKTYEDASHKTETKGVQRRELTRDDVKKEYPDLPSAAIDSIYNSLTDKKKKVNGAAGNTDRVKHDDMSSVLAHFNTHHDPKNGQFTTANGSTGSSQKKVSIGKAVKKGLKIGAATGASVGGGSAVAATIYGTAAVAKIVAELGMASVASPGIMAASGAGMAFLTGAMSAGLGAAILAPGGALVGLGVGAAAKGIQAYKNHKAKKAQSETTNTSNKKMSGDDPDKLWKDKYDRLYSDESIKSLHKSSKESVEEELKRSDELFERSKRG